VCWLFLAGIELPNALQMVIEILSLRGIDIDHRGDLVIHGFLDQSSMKMTRIEGHQGDEFFSIASGSITFHS
jgi:hypothetical protein